MVYVLSNGQKAPNGTTKMPPHVVRYVACGNLKHTLKVEKGATHNPAGARTQKGRCWVQKQAVECCLLRDEASETTALE